MPGCGSVRSRSRSARAPEPSNVSAGGQACPFWFRWLGCGHFRSDPSFLSAADQTSQPSDLVLGRVARWWPTRQGRSLTGSVPGCGAGSARSHACGQVGRRGPERRRTGCIAGGHRGVAQGGRSNTSAWRNDPAAHRRLASRAAGPPGDGNTPPVPRPHGTNRSNRTRSEVSC